ncbi:type I methionyl aminopeptidase [Miniphocaeibacter halophilus]|uniref:Type I methionyl aminopeptidase n=1 Tax=Miniphocaeibacter halophilus TaxID=2931922 RepID=A0AC61MTY0_9FIRM|nr:type I methionyl aminopeptidase [Miniphocaeibacter halophilus]QQK07816.1 type I methionyl aminopeptidase [Miniphocaeibacter halophilus]
MIYIKSKNDIERMKKAGNIVATMHEALRDYIKPGISTLEVNEFCENHIRKSGGKPVQIGYHGFPYATCTSVNDEICHGFPTEYILKAGDLITVDTVVEYDGFMGDSAWSYHVGEASEKVMDLMKTTKECLYIGIEKAIIGNRLGDIGHAIQEHAEGKGYSVVREFTGHGIGKDMHEDPMVPHFGKPGRGIRLEEGMVITIEPMINTGKWKSVIDDNNWTARTIDGGLSCQYEHTLAITAEGPIILTKQKGEEDYL